MYTMLEDGSETAARRSLDVIVELYRRNLWTDGRTVNVLASACLSKVGSPPQRTPEVPLVAVTGRIPPL